MGFDKASLYARLGALKRDLIQKSLLTWQHALYAITYGPRFIKRYLLPTPVSSQSILKERGPLPPPFQLQPILGSTSRHPLTKLHQQVTLRWFAANVITAISGGLLMAVALYVPMQGQTSFAEFPKFINRVSFLSSLFERKEEVAPKADKLMDPPPSEVIRHVFKGSIPEKVGNREVRKMRNLVRLIMPLSSANPSLKIPPFNSKTFLARSKTDSKKSTTPTSPESLVSPAPSMEMADEDITFTTHKFSVPQGLSFWENSPSFSEAQIFHQVVQTSTPSPGQTKPETAQEQLANTLTIPVQTSKTASGHTLRKSDMEYPILDTQILPENVSARDKSEDTDNSVSKVIPINTGDNLEKILKENHAPPEMIKDLLQALGSQKSLRQLTAGDRVEILLETPLGGDKQTPTRLTLFDEKGDLYAMVALNDQNQFVPVVLSEVDLKASKNQLNITKSTTVEKKNDRASRAPLYNSVYATITNNNIPLSLIGELIRIFVSDLDFQKPVGGKKTLDILYADAETGSTGRPEILYANFGIGNEHFAVYRYVSPKDLSVTYYNPQGESLKKFLLRKPLAHGNISSGFGLRSHPILRFKRVHTGVDWAAPIGTPILAAADGVVAYAAWNGGYGRHIRLTHRNGYTTTYSHLSGMAKGMKQGIQVRQGQVIGYLGSSGLSTGPHLHYEVMINGRFMDPMKVKLPQGQGTDSSLPADFMAQKAKIDTLLASSDKNQPKEVSKS